MEPIVQLWIVLLGGCIVGLTAGRPIREVPMSVQATGEQPASDRAWSIETNGINVVPDSERHGSPFELFWVWCAANISILAVVYGVIIVSFGLNVWQSVLAGVAGTVLSFLLVGFVSLAGKRSGAPTFALSRAPFGLFGNALPTLTSYLSLVGWETVLVALATLAVNSMLDRLGVATGTHTTVIAFLVIGPVLLITFGVLLASRGTGLSTSANPLGDLAAPLPTWFLVPYMLVAAGGLVAGALLDIYSSGLNLLTLGVRLPRYQSVAIDGVI